MNNKLPEILGYVVVDSPYNRKHYPSLIGRGFAAPPGYAAVLPYRSLKTEGFTAPEGYVPRQAVEKVEEEKS